MKLICTFKLYRVRLLFLSGYYWCKDGIFFSVHMLQYQSTAFELSNFLIEVINFPLNLKDMRHLLYIRPTIEFDVAIFIEKSAQVDEALRLAMARHGRS